MSRRSTTVGLLVAGAALAGVLGYLLLDGGRGAARSSGGAPGVTVREPRRERPAGEEAGPVLTAEQQVMVKAALGALGNDAAVRTAFTDGVERPWPAAEARKQFERCIPIINRGLPQESKLVPAQVCACITRALQGTYPGEPPRPANGNATRAFEESFRTAFRECTEPY